jgi:hypothetical protein
MILSNQLPVFLRSMEYYSGLLFLVSDYPIAIYNLHGSDVLAIDDKSSWSY